MSYFSQKDVLKLERKINKAINEKQNIRTTESYANQKIKNIYNFLEKVESESNSINEFPLDTRDIRDTITTKDTRDPRDTRDTRDTIPTSINKENYLDENSTENRTKLLNLKLELDEANKTIDSLKKIIEKERSKNKELEVAHEQVMSTKLKEQKEEMEEIIDRHIKFIDQLVNDKKELNQQCEELMKQLKEIDSKNAKSFNELKEKYQRDLKSSKEQWIASEKQRKEKWEKDKEKEIKEMTIRGLEPEFERIMNKSKQDAKKAEEKAQAEIAKIREELYLDYETKLKQYKEKLLRENDETMVKEREFLTNKLKDQYDQMEKKFLEDRDKLRKGYDSQIEFSEMERKKEAERYHQTIKSLQDEQFREIRKIKDEYETKYDEIKTKCNNELAKQKENFKLEQQNWYKAQETKIKDEINQKVNKLKEEIEKERDEQIETIINKLTEEKFDNGSNEKVRYERKIEELKGIHAEEVKKLKREIQVLESQLKDEKQQKQSTESNTEILSKKLYEIQNQLDIRTKELISAQSTINFMKKELETVLNTQRDNELSWKKQMELDKLKFNEEIRKLKEQILEIQRNAEKTIESNEEKHVQQLEDVEAKVKKAITKKDYEINKLKEELRYKEAACQKFEELLEKQRKDLMH